MPLSDLAELRLLETAANVTGSVVLALDLQHRVIFWNRAAEELYGVSTQDASGLDYVATFIVPEQREAIAADIQKVLGGEPTWGFEDDSMTVEGKRRTLVWNVHRLVDAAGIVRGILASGYDVTSRKDAERAFRLVWNQSTEGLLLGDGPGVIDCNPTALDMLGLTDRMQLVGRHPHEFSPEFQPDGIASREKARRMDEITRERGEYRFEWVHQKLDGTPVPTAVHVRRVMMDGRPITVIAWLDLTEQHAVAAREADLQARLLRSKKLDALGHLAGGIAHDFNNLLSAISGSLDLAILDVDSQSAAAAELRVAQETTVRAASLVRQLLTFGRQNKKAYWAFDLSAHIAASEAMLRRLLPPSITLTMQASPRPLFVLGDASQLDQVVVNLVVNARDAMRDGGVLTLRVGPGEGGQAATARLEVTDSGPGIDGDVLDRVFDPFFTTKPIGAGTGLGLAVVYGLVSSHDGTVHIESTVGVGTSVRVDLPLIATPPQTSAAATADADATREGVVASGGANVNAGGVLLIVEDDSSVRRTLCRIARRAGYDVLEATQGAEALTIWHTRQHDIRAVLSDVRMPVMSGPEFVRQLRTLGSRVPVVLMSGFADAELTRSLPAGVTQVLAKPFVAAELLSALRAALSGVAEGGPSMV